MTDGEPRKYLGIVDLVVFFGTIGLAVLVGIYYAVVDRKKNVDNYNFGGRNMSPIPVGLSIAVTYISAITVIGFPAETYLFGTVMFWFAVTSLIPNIVACIYYIPMIHRLRLATINEYLELRFHRYNRQIASGLSLISLMIYMGVTIYVPSLALNAVTPLSLTTIIMICSLTCTLYTTLGGMKAVIWTDTIQTVAMVVGGMAAMIKTLIMVGGFGNAVAVSTRGGRLNFWNFNPDPTIRYTVWSFIFGKAIFGCGTTCVNQSIAQRYLSCKTINKARIAAMISVIPTFILMGIAVTTGMAMYTYYEGCDPLMSGKITKPDQMLPFLVVDVFQELPGMAGLFVAAAFSGTLSTVSSGLNSLAVLLLHDFVLLKKPNLSSRARLTLNKLIVFGLGVFLLGFALTVSTFDGTVLRISFSIGSVLAGPVIGVFTLGVFFPWTTAKGAGIGQLVGTAFSAWISYGSLAQGKSSHGNKPLTLSTERCPVYLNENTTSFLSSNADVFASTTVDTFDIATTTAAPPSYSQIQTTFYAISFLYYSTIAIIVTVTFGLIGSFITGANNPKKADPNLFVPFIDNRYLPEAIRIFFRFGVPPISERSEKEKLEPNYNDEEESSRRRTYKEDNQSSCDKESVL